MILDVAAMVLLAGGTFFLLVSTVGLLRLPDFFTRAHAVGKSETLGSLLLLSGLAIHAPGIGLGLKLMLVVLFVAVTNPAGIHVLTRAALRSGIEIWVLPEDRGRPPETAVRSDPERPNPEDAR